jgi:tRNA pseudouridine38-40 synthase
MRFALAVEYQGTAFCGFQSQPSGCGVQDALERAIGAIAGHEVRVTAAGRTDAGVHAVSQIVHFDTEAKRPDTAWVRGVNSHLPAAAAVLWARPVAEDFHARFAASARHYTYLLLIRTERTALLAGLAGWYHRPLDAALMNAAAAHLVGTHDFSSFRAAECQAKSPVKELRLAYVARRGDYLLCDFRADGFLHHMVRNLMGCLIHVGAGAQPPAWLRDILESRDRALAAPTFDAAGLYLTHIRYPADFDLPETSDRWLFA